MKPRDGIALALAALVQVLPQSAYADPVYDPAAADELFNRAKELLGAGNWSEACAKFQGSMDLDPSIGTLLKIAKCHEHDGKIALALHDYRTALAMNRQKVDQTAQRRAQLDEYTRHALAQLEPRVPTLHVVITERPNGLRVTRAGQELPVAALGEELPVDPGPLEIVAEAPGYETVHRTVMLREGEKIDVTIALRPSINAPPSVGASPGTATNPSSSDAPPRPSSIARVLGYSVGAGGVIALGIAGWLALETLSKVSDSSHYCSPNDRCTSQGVTLRDEARETQTAALVTLLVGAALVGTGVVLIATSPPSKGARKPPVVTTSLAAGLGAFGPFLRGSF